MQVKIVKMNSFQGVGIPWQGTYEQADQGALRELQHAFKKRISKIKSLNELESIIGLSYNHDEKGFHHYYLIKKDRIGQVPKDLKELHVPGSLYVTFQSSGFDIQTEYRNLYKWIEENNYVINQDSYSLEMYPIDYDPINDQPRFTIYIPIKAKESVEG